MYYFVFASLITTALIFSGCSSLQFQGRYQGRGSFNAGNSSGNSTEGLSNSEKNQRERSSSHSDSFSTEFSSGEFNLRWPLKKIKISQGYRPSKNPSHEGVDLVGKYLSPIYAAHDGYIVYIGSQYRGYGRIIILEFNKHWGTLYGHLESIYVKEGQKIHRGQKIAAMGNTGRSTGVHLHFEVLKDKKPIDPVQAVHAYSKHNLAQSQ